MCCCLFLSFSFPQTTVCAFIFDVLRLFDLQITLQTYEKHKHSIEDFINVQLPAIQDNAAVRKCTFRWVLEDPPDAKKFNQDNITFSRKKQGSPYFSQDFELAADLL
jgi:hypothetical protein